MNRFHLGLRGKETGLPWHALGDSTLNGSGAHRPTGRSPTLTASKSSLLGHFRGPFFDAFPSESHKTALAVTNSVIGQCTSHYPTLSDTTCGRSSLGRRSWNHFPGPEGVGVWPTAKPRVGRFARWERLDFGVTLRPAERLAKIAHVELS